MCFSLCCDRYDYNTVTLLEQCASHKARITAGARKFRHGCHPALALAAAQSARQ
jgi:hypothetical protein